MFLRAIFFPERNLRQELEWSTNNIALRRVPKMPFSPFLHTYTQTTTSLLIPQLTQHDVQSTRPKPGSQPQPYTKEAPWTGKIYRRGGTSAMSCYFVVVGFATRSSTNLTTNHIITGNTLHNRTRTSHERLQTLHRIQTPQAALSRWSLPRPLLDLPPSLPRSHFRTKGKFHQWYFQVHIGMTSKVQ